jgi:hypothetical protein
MNDNDMVDVVLVFVLFLFFVVCFSLGMVAVTLISATFSWDVV